MLRKHSALEAWFYNAIAQNNFEELREIASEVLDASQDKESLIAALLKLAFKDELNEENYREISQEEFRKPAILLPTKVILLSNQRSFLC